MTLDPTSLYKARAAAAAGMEPIRKQPNGLPDPAQVYEQRRQQVQALRLDAMRESLLTDIALS